MTEQNYSGSCQCEAVRFEAALDLDKAMICNCSRCQRLGWVMAFAPRPKVSIAAGEDATTEYRFNKARIGHRFCRICGVQTFAFATQADGTEMVAVNVNCLEGVDPRALTPKAVDGRSF